MLFLALIVQTTCLQDHTLFQFIIGATTGWFPYPTPGPQIVSDPYLVQWKLKSYAQEIFPPARILRTFLTQKYIFDSSTSTANQ